MVSGAKRNEPCPCGSGRKYKRCCIERDGVAGGSRDEDGSRSGFGRIYSYEHPDEVAADELVLLVETPAGLLSRRVPSASPLRPDVTKGEAAEDATRDSAAFWGLPDFAYRACVRKVGSGSRELGDGTLIVGDRGVAVQVKSRLAPSDDEAKERRWIGKQVRRASAQANGTIRSLRNTPAELTNARGRTIEVDGSQLRWVIAIVIDHPNPPKNLRPPRISTRTGAVVLLRRDWDFLFDQLRSTHAVAAYLSRVEDDPIDLGLEPVRYYELATADAQAPPEPAHPSISGSGEVVSTPLVPLEPAAADDAESHLLVRGLFEDIATTVLEDTSETSRLWALGELDRLPVGQRARIGHFLMDALGDVVNVDAPAVKWQFRRVVGGPGRAHLAFAACSRFNSDIQYAFSTWVQLRHHEHQQSSGDTELSTVGVLITPRRDGRRPWDTTMAAVGGDLELTPDDLDAYRELWGSRGTAPAL